MTKAKIIVVSVLIFLIALISVLFGAVFRIRTQTIVAVGEDKEFCEEISAEIKASAKIKNGQSTFMLDKNIAIKNIEKTHPYIKVVQIKTKSVTEIEIKVRKRYEMYYAEANGKYYVLDEDLKVLRITDLKPEITLFNVTKLSITNNTKVGDFVGSSYYQKISYNLFTALYSHALLDRSEITSFITSVSFDIGYTADGEESYNRLILKTNTGVEMDIYKPEKDLNRKINICFSAYNDDEFTSQQKSEGIIKIYLDKNGEEKIGYIQPNISA